MSHRSLLCCVMAFAILVPGLRPLAAQPAPPVQLEWTAPEGCPDADYVLNAVAQMPVGSPGPYVQRAGRVVARAAVVRSADGWRVDVTVQSKGTEGHRTLEAGSCWAVADAAAMVIGLAAASDVRFESGALPPEPASPTPRPAPPAVVPNPLAARFLVASAAAHGFVIVGRFPGAAVGVEGGLDLAIGSSRLQVLGTWAPDQSFALDTAPGVHATMRSYGGALRACHRWRLGALWAGPCVSGGVVRLEGRATADELPQGAQLVGRLGGTTVAEASGGIVAALPLGIAALELGAEAGVSGTQRTFVLAKEPTAPPVWSHTPALILGRVWLGAAIHF